ncbi:VWA domain-containing protein [Mycobacterium vicinigordonae]|uniref:VWA domain-containing protein n=1 Tax=Mycobacterium vicinigordonae TaxID=1719132 RepID=A0A7D6I779_9MYCO|nr:VWA domain-containing protein [Mycobacterium vicinigordonae]QLL06297.1 VWA domain-containing protein [Mycobacterium vicinigordonae]
MNLPLLGPLTFSGFSDAWLFLYLLIVALLIAAYVVATLARRRRMMRFANMALLEQVAPARQPGRWRHLPVALLVVALALLTTAMAGPTHDIRIPRNRAVVMLVIDVSESMVATDVAPSRIEAAKAAGKAFTDELTPGINLGLVAFGGTATLLVPPTTNRTAMKAAIDHLQPEERTATGEAIFTALQAIATVVGIIGGGDGKPPPARIVLESDGKETVPVDLNAPRGAFTAARAAKDQGVQISTISFGTLEGTVNLNGTDVPVPVDDESLGQIAELSGGQAFQARSLDQLRQTYAALQQQIGYETIKGDASAAWIGLGVVLLAASLAAAALLNRRLPD